MSLARRFAASSSWLVLGTSAENIIQFIIFAMLARLLPVRDLGIVAFALMFMDVSRIFVAGGMPQAIVQRKEWDDHLSSVCFTYNALMSLLVATLFVVVAAPLMERYYAQGSGLVCAALALVFLVEAVKGVHAAKLRREMKYRSLAVRGTIAALVSGAVSITMAYGGAGVWSLVVQRFTNQAVLTVLTWRAARWRPRLVWDMAALRTIWPFGARVTTHRALEMLNLRMPDIIVGVIVGPVGIAFYRVGARALDTLRKIVILPFQDASFAAMSRLQEPPAIAAAYVRLSRAAATATFPIFFGSTAIAFELTVMLFGEKYAPSGDVFALLALAGVPSTLILFAASAFMAAGHPRLGMLTNGALALFNLVFVSLLARLDGAIGAALGNLAALASTVPIVVLLMRNQLGLKVRDLASALFPPALIAIVMTALLWILKLYALANVGRLGTVAILVAAGAILYTGIFAIWGRAHLRELTADLRRILPTAVQERLQSRYSRG